MEQIRYSRLVRHLFEQFISCCISEEKSLHLYEEEKAQLKQCVFVSMPLCVNIPPKFSSADRSHVPDERTGVMIAYSRLHCVCMQGGKNIQTENTVYPSMKIGGCFKMFSCLENIT